ncbi:MAG: cytidylate kinase family protein [bacterium]|nr:cytidylate kinase family protein [bacterium]
MIISITGGPGTGKTSVGKILAKRLGFRFYSVGALRGKLAMDRNLTIDELNTFGETDSSTDNPVDEYQRELGIKEDDFVIEGRLSWHFIPHSFKVFLTCDIEEASLRIYNAQKSNPEDRQDESTYNSAEDAKKAILNRVASDVIRYKKYYDIDYRDASHYDLVIETGPIQSAEAVADVVEKAVRGVNPDLSI